MTAKKVDVQDTETGRKYTIPERWLELDHPQFKRFKKTARQSKADETKGQTAGSASSTKTKED